MNQELNDLGAKVGLKWLDYQVKTLEAVQARTGLLRECLYYKTGAGKSVTSLACMALKGQVFVLVIAPPSTHAAWQQWGLRFGIGVDCMSHAKFRMKDTRISRHTAVIADEFHLFGGHDGKGWKRFDTLARHSQAPIIVLSATPSYNDADRVYCIQHALDPLSCRGGFIDFLYKHCETEQDPFSMKPKVLGFRNYPGNADTDGAAAYLADLPYVHYLPDDLVYTINDVPIATVWPLAAETYGLNERRDRIMASDIEARHARVDLSLINDHGFLRQEAYDEVAGVTVGAHTPILMFAAHSTVALAMSNSLAAQRVKHGLVTGDTSKKAKADLIAQFNRGELEVLVGTASLATGTDGMDKVCDWLIILDDTDDDSLRRQLVGRIMPRGLDTDASKKQVYRLLLT